MIEHKLQVEDWRFERDIDRQFKLFSKKNQVYKTLDNGVFYDLSFWSREPNAHFKEIA
tara:strand:- start:75 stop:248 length:174 start_codon:yes stop_codon:yes gene_type:complete